MQRVRAHTKPEAGTCWWQELPDLAAEFEIGPAVLLLTIVSETPGFANISPCTSLKVVALGSSKTNFFIVLIGPPHVLGLDKCLGAALNLVRNLFHAILNHCSYLPIISA